jgi:catechol 2,3-dioxygenase-like lactoylglutathione lyase family enzyme
MDPLLPCSEDENASRRSVTVAGVSHPPLMHLALAVRNQARSRAFYERYFGFDQPGQRYPDGVLMLRNRDGFSLALGPEDPGARLPSFLHFGFRAPSPSAVCELRDRLAGEGVEIAEETTEECYVSIKVRDPDGYVVEYSWEIPELDPTV